MSQLLEFERLNNTRDLGGMKTSDGRKIKKGLLYRSGYLQKASAADIDKLSSFGLTDIIDFRSSGENREQPDPPVGSAQMTHLPAEDERLLGIERDKESEKQFAEILIERVIERPEYAIEYMCGMYRRFINNEYTTAQYRKFLEIVRNSGGAVLWHCTAGKDRAGFASILIQEILGIPREEVYEDNLMTNQYIKEESEQLIEMFSRMVKGPYPKEAVRYFFSADEKYLDALYEEADRKYGSFENCLREAFGIDEETKEVFRKKYLEEI